MTDPSPAPPAGPTRPRLRLTAIVGLVASVLAIASYFLPWVVIPEQDRQRLRAELGPRLDDLAREAPETAEGARQVLDQVVEEGTLAGIDLFHYVRRAIAIHGHYEGVEPAAELTGTPWVVRRAFRLAALLLAAVPLVCAAIGLAIVGGGFRRAGARTLTALIVAGTTGGALALSWLRVFESLTWDYLGDGVRLAVAAGVAQVGAGVFGVTAKNWWRAYAWAVTILVVVSALSWVYVRRGVLP